MKIPRTSRVSINESWIRSIPPTLLLLAALGRVFAEAP